jgi:hypothetical protein
MLTLLFLTFVVAPVIAPFTRRSALARVKIRKRG